MIVRHIAIGLGIALMLPLLIAFGVKSFVPPPNMQDYVHFEPFHPNMTPEERAARDAKQKEQQTTYAQAAHRYADILLMVEVPVSVIAILAGSLLELSGIGTGLIAGGILTLLLGQWGFIGQGSNWLRFIGLLAGFLSLIFSGYRLMKRSAKTIP